MAQGAEHCTLPRTRDQLGDPAEANVLLHVGIRSWIRHLRQQNIVHDYIPIEVPHNYKLVQTPKARIEAARMPAIPGRKALAALVGVALALLTPDAVPDGTEDDELAIEAVEAVAVQLTNGQIRSVAGTCVEWFDGVVYVILSKSTGRSARPSPPRIYRGSPKYVRFCSVPPFSIRRSCCPSGSPPAKKCNPPNFSHDFSPSDPAHPERPVR